MERCKILVKNFERTLANATTKINLCFIHLMIKRLTASPQDLSNRLYRNRVNQMSATRHSWSNLQPLPVQRSTLSLQRTFTEPEYEHLCNGLIPDRMEDKWFIFLEDDVLYVHRSWTGYCIYQLSLTRADSTYAISRALVNRDPNQYTWVDDRYDEKLLIFLIDHLLLGEHSPLPMTANIPAGIATELHLQHVIGIGRSTETTPKEITLPEIFRWLWHWLLFLIKR
jgi:hypothetical protein